MNRVLWICNIMLPAIGQELGLPYSSREGWLSGIFERLGDGQAPFTLGICFPLGEKELLSIPQGEGGMISPGDGGHSSGKKRGSGSGAGGDENGGVRKLTVRGIVCYAFEEDLSAPEIYDPGMEGRFRQIFQDFRPQMIHIFGTEFPHALAAVRAYGNARKTLVGIQGLCGEIARVYMAGLPEKVQKSVTFRDIVRRDSIRQQQEKFALRGRREAEVICGSGNITGRTRFDREGTRRLHPGARYYPMNETMRREFYTGQWHMEDCEKHSIFLGQGDYPLKGMHFVLKAMGILLPRFPDMKLYVAGNSVIGNGSLKEKIKLPAYGKYLLGLIREQGLEGKVIMTGRLDAGEMKEQFLKSSLYLCPSVLENSPNTVGEAQLLGVPVAASRAGGIPDMIEDKVDGLLFPAGDERLLARAVEALWDDRKGKDGCCLAQRISANARRRARKVHDGEKNYARLLEIYAEILEEK